MKLQEMFATIKSHPRIRDAGMILCHNGIVRGTSRDGRKVKEIKVKVNHETLTKIISEVNTFSDITFPLPAFSMVSAFSY